MIRYQLSFSRGAGRVGLRRPAPRLGLRSNHGHGAHPHQIVGAEARVNIQPTRAPRRAEVRVALRERW